MPWDDYLEGSPADAESLAVSQPAMSRRSMLRTTAGAGAASLIAGAALGTAAPAVAAARPAKRARSADSPRPASDEQVVVHVRNARSGEMDVFAGTSQTRLVDPDLAARLVQAAR